MLSTTRLPSGQNCWALLLRSGCFYKLLCEAGLPKFVCTAVFAFVCPDSLLWICEGYAHIRRLPRFTPLKPLE